jgi:hypothetical protein
MQKESFFTEGFLLRDKGKYSKTFPHVRVVKSSYMLT